MTTQDPTNVPDPYPRLAIVTGADSGIGRATALLLASEGFDIGLTVHHDVGGAYETAREVEMRGQRCFKERFDASSPDAGATIDRLADQLGGLGALVNVAGTGQSQMALDMPLETWQHVLATDLTGPLLTAQRAARRMIADGHGGRIVNVTSVHEHVPRVGSSAYCAAKAGLGMLTQVLALELAQHGITVNSVAPGEIATEMTGQDEEDAYRRSRPGNPLGVPGTSTRSHRSSASSHPLARPMSPAPRMPLTVASCSWRPTATTRPRTGARSDDAS